jgi:proteasome lid subunit RPN8/RPN11
MLKKHVIIKKSVIDSIVSYCKMLHPREALLILRGKVKKDLLIIDNLLIPPFAYNTPFYVGFPTHMLPFDASIVGTAHSHPNGVVEPSLTDMHNFIGFLSIIVGYPYEDDDIRAYDSDGNIVRFSIEQ